MVDVGRTLVPREVRSSIDELVRGATSRTPWKTAESLSGSAFELVEIDGLPFVLKHLHVDDDWIQRSQGDIYSRPVVMWRAGLFDALPGSLDHTIVDIAAGLGRNGWGAAVLMRDVSPHMVRVSDGLIPLEQHRRFLDRMAELHASFFGFTDTIGLMPLSNRFFSVGHPLMASYEISRGDPDPVPSMIPGGWEHIAEHAPALWKVVRGLLDDPMPLAMELATGPQTLVHSDWKAGNLGSLPDGRTVLIDWAFPGEAPCAIDLAWYIGVNCDLLPESKEDAIDAYRTSLEERGVETSAWWDRQLELSLLGVFMQLGWSKTGDELSWWEHRAPRALRYL